MPAIKIIKKWEIWKWQLLLKIDDVDDDMMTTYSQILSSSIKIWLINILLKI